MTKDDNLVISAICVRDSGRFDLGHLASRISAFGRFELRHLPTPDLGIRHALLPTFSLDFGCCGAPREKTSADHFRGHEVAEACPADAVSRAAEGAVLGIEA